MYESWEQYKSGQQAAPAENVVWHLYGVGLETLGRDKTPESKALPQPGPDELLARVDAAGLCFSDTKIIKLGGDHPRLYGRDLANDPIIPGHEAAITIIAVGENRAAKYAVGDRFVVQADIYYKGVNLAFGYMLPGALEQYVIITREVLDGDDGCYLVPVAKDTGYSEAALAEPWACVVRAYRDVRRRGLKDGGSAWVIGTPGSEAHTYRLPGIEYGGVPCRVLLTGAPAQVEREISMAAGGGGVDVIVTAPLAELDVAEMVEKHTGGAGFDDVFILGSGNVDAIEAVDKALAKRGRMTFVTDKPFSRGVNLDVGRVHYDDTYYAGARAADPLAAYRPIRDLNPKAGGKTWIVGGAGPMGQMHLQMAIENPKRPAFILITDIDDERLATAVGRFADTARENGVELASLNPTTMSPDEFDARLKEVAPEGFDDIIMMAAVPALITSSCRYLADDGMFNVFAGVARGTTAELDGSGIALRGHGYVGSSGSGIEDLAEVIRRAEKGQLSTNRAVAGIGGMNAAWDGMEAVRDGTFSGKIVIYPQIADLPLTDLDDLADVLPEVAAKLGPGKQWTREAEQALLEHFVIDA